MQAKYGSETFDSWKPWKSELGEKQLNKLLVESSWMILYKKKWEIS